MEKAEDWGKGRESLGMQDRMFHVSMFSWLHMLVMQPMTAEESGGEVKGRMMEEEEMRRSLLNVRGQKKKRNQIDFCISIKKINKCQELSRKENLKDLLLHCSKCSCPGYEVEIKIYTIFQTNIQSAHFKFTFTVFFTVALYTIMIAVV